MARANNTPPGKWRYAAGRKPHTVVAFERPDKGNSVWLRWTSLDETKDAPDKMSLGFRVRDAPDNLIKEFCEKAQLAADRAYARLCRGEDPRDPEPEKDQAPRQLAIAAGLERALRVPGMYAVESAHSRDMCRYMEHVLRHLPTDVDSWDKLGPTKYQALWQHIAHWRKKANVRTRNGEIEGKRAAELAIVLLQQAGRWLHEDSQLEHLPRMAKKNWREAFNADWARITGDSNVERDQPRHSPEELGKLWLAIDNRLGDPRLCLAMETAGEARLGQALRCDRTMLDLSEIGAHRLGRFKIPDTGKKKGALIDLTPRLRAAWDYELSEGYLRDLEAAYRARHARTYPLFPGKRLVRGVARIDAQASIGKEAALDLFHELEILAGVEVVDGRGWYGVRRIAADIAEDVEKDGRALNAITGHTSDETRRKVYQQKIRDAVLARASDARHAARTVAIEAATAAGRHALPTDTVRTPSRWEQNRANKLERRRDAHGSKPAAARRPATYPPKPCAMCGVEFVPEGSNTRACSSCSPRRRRPLKSAAPTPEPTPA